MGFKEPFMLGFIFGAIMEFWVHTLGEIWVSKKEERENRNN